MMNRSELFTAACTLYIVSHISIISDYFDLRVALSWFGLSLLSLGAWGYVRWREEKEEDHLRELELEKEFEDSIIEEITDEEQKRLQVPDTNL